MKLSWKPKNKRSVDGDKNNLPRQPQDIQKENARALNSLQRALARRDHSVQELKTKLARYYSPEAVEYALKEADARRWLRPENELVEAASQMYGRKLKSHSYIKQQMQKRGLPTPDLDFEKEQDKINELIKRRFGNADLSNFEQRVKVMRFLRYRGFDLRAINAAIKDVEVGYEEP